MQNRPIWSESGTVSPIRPILECKAVPSEAPSAASIYLPGVVQVEGSVGISHRDLLPIHRPLELVQRSTGDGFLDDRNLCLFVQVPEVQGPEAIDGCKHGGVRGAPLDVVDGIAGLLEGIETGSGLGGPQPAGPVGGSGQEEVREVDGTGGRVEVQASDGSIVAFESFKDAASTTSTFMRRREDQGDCLSWRNPR